MSQHVSRNLLHVSKLDEFLRWTVAQGFAPVFYGYQYEAARILGEHVRVPIIIYKRDRSEHYTLDARAQELVLRWLDERKAAQ